MPVLLTAFAVSVGGKLIALATSKAAIGFAAFYLGWQGSGIADKAVEKALDTWKHLNGERSASPPADSPAPSPPGPPPSPSAAAPPTRDPLRRPPKTFASAECLIPLDGKDGGTEDAACHHNEAGVIAIADGVSDIKPCYGFSARLLSRWLMSRIREVAPLYAISRWTENRAVDILLHVWGERALGEGQRGACTVVVVAMVRDSWIDIDNLHVAAWGDSVALLLRRDRFGKLFILYRSGIMVEPSLPDVPVQLSALPRTVGWTTTTRVNPSPAVLRRSLQQLKWSVQEGDLLLAMTDGVNDNLFHEQIESVANQYEPYAEPAVIAQAICEAAHSHSVTPTSVTPFGTLRHRHGGKPDDISVGAAWVRRAAGGDDAAYAAAQQELVPRWLWPQPPRDRRRERGERARDR